MFYKNESVKLLVSVLLQENWQISKSKLIVMLSVLHFVKIFGNIVCFTNFIIELKHEDPSFFSFFETGFGKG